METLLIPLVILSKYRDINGVNDSTGRVSVKHYRCLWLFKRTFSCCRYFYRQVNQQNVKYYAGC